MMIESHEGSSIAGWSDTWNISDFDFFLCSIRAHSSFLDSGRIMPDMRPRMNYSDYTR